MKVQIQNKQLQTAIKSLKKVFDKGAVVDPVHVDQCILSGSADGTVCLEAASNGLYVSTQMLADVEDPGAVVLDRDYLSVKFPGASISFNYLPESKKLVFVSGALDGDISVSDDTDEVKVRFPLKTPSLSIELPLESLQTGCKHICFNPTTTDALSLYLVVADGVMVMTTNDRYRGAGVRIPVPNHRGEGRLHIPAAFLTNVLASIDDAIVRLGFDDHSIRIKGGGIDVCHPVLQDAQTDLKDVWGLAERMNQQNTLVWSKFSAREAKAAVDAVASIPFAKSDGELRVALTPSDKGHINVSMHSTVSSAKYSFGVDEIEMQQPYPMTFNQRYLSEFLGLMGNTIIEATATDRVFIARVEESMVWLIPMTAD